MSLKIFAWIRNVKPAPFEVSCGIYLRLLGVVYLAAFASLWTQVDGLVGSHGILPVADFLDAAGRQLGRAAYYELPTLCWLDSSDAFLQILCGGGSLIAAFAIIFPLCSLPWIALWVFYLSLYTAGQDFLGFQWDILLLETGFLAIFLAPMTVRPGWTVAYAPPRLFLWLSWWLLFRLLFASGVVKLTWKDPSWQIWGSPESLTALTYHYETQCIPPWTAWYLHQLPAGFHKASCAAMYFIEIVASCCIFLPRRARLVACLLQALFQLAIITSGNYGFFNYITVSLCVLLVDDATWPARLRKEAAARRRARPWPTWILAPVAALIVLASVPVFVSGLSPGLRAMAWPSPLGELSGLAQRVDVVHAYGLFRDMTKERPEIIIEGSDDAKEWKAYEFRYKAGDLARRPRFVAPHQPRLDWQMWFAALGGARQQHWFLALCVRLLEGSKPVLDLLESNPFPEKPPRYVRAQMYDYRFTTFEERARTGNWWKRESKGPFLRAVKLEDFRRH